MATLRFLTALLLVLAIGLVSPAQEAHAEVGRIYSSPIAGDGTDENPFQAAVCLLAGTTRCRSAITSFLEGANRGKPSLGFSLVYIEASSYAAHDAAEATPNLNIVRLDNEGNFDAAMPSNLRTRLQQVGAATQQELNPYTSYRDILLYLLNKHYPAATLAIQFPEFFGP